MAINEKATGNDSVAITGTASAGERTIGVKGIGDSTGIHGEGKSWNGVEGISHSTIGAFGVFGSNTAGGTGVAGVSTGSGMGVYGKSESGAGVMGDAVGTGVIGQSKTWMGVYGKSESTTGGAGVMGDAVGTGVIGQSKTWIGVYGKSESTTGGSGVMGEAVGTGAGIYGKGGRVAGYFEGDVEVTGDIRLTNADCAEDFNIGLDVLIEPGTVMVLGEKDALYPSQHAYDKRVAGVISGAGDYKPGIVLDKQQSRSDRKPSDYKSGIVLDKQTFEDNRQPIALLGKAYCKVDAQCGAIDVGDLLTTSPTPGHAMKADDPAKAFGAVIGKALRPLKEGKGLIPILIALQ
jgi:hypothetical protein